MSILVIGTFDSKKVEYEFLMDELRKLGAQFIAMDVGSFSEVEIGESQRFISSSAVLEAAGESTDEIRKTNDRGLAMKAMAAGAAILAAELFENEQITGIIGMGGSGGSSVISTAMQALPIGVPKVLLSTMAGGETGVYVGSKDITMIPSITDISGLNRITKTMIATAASAVFGMSQGFESRKQNDNSKKVMAASMFGNTTDCVNHCRELLESDSTEVIVFHATGTGGKTMEALIEDGFVDGCLDITTTEIADEVCGGILSAGPNRLRAAGNKGIPHLVVPGCIDMANFGTIESVPRKYREAKRNLYEWNPSITLMRTDVEENIQMGKIFAERLNSASGPVQVLIPLKGVSILDGDGERFCDREADQAMFDTLKAHLREDIQVTELNCNINDQEFSFAAVEIFNAMM